MTLIWYETALCVAFILASWGLVFFIGNRVKELFHKQTQLLNNLEGLRAAFGRFINDEFEENRTQLESLLSLQETHAQASEDYKNVILQELKDMRKKPAKVAKK